MPSSRSERLRLLAEVVLAMALLWPLVPAAARWNRAGIRVPLAAWLLGAFLGLLLARRHPRWFVAAVICSLTLIWIQLGNLWPPLELLRADLAALSTGHWPPGATWRWLLPEAAGWLRALRSDRAILTGLVWHCLLVMVTAGTLWRLRRLPEVAGWTLLPAPLIVISFETLLAGRSSGALLWVLAAGMTLAVTREALGREQSWERFGFDYSDEIKYEVLGLGIVVVLVALLVGYLSPGLMELEAARPVYAILNIPWQTVNRLSGGRLEKLARHSAPPLQNLAGGPPVHRLSGARVVSDDLLLRVTLPESARPLPLRWRVWVLDRYDGRGWSVTEPLLEATTGTWGRQGPGVRQIVQAAPGHSLVGGGLPAANGVTWTDGAAGVYRDPHGTLIGLRAGRDRFTVLSNPATPVELTPEQRARATALPPTTPPRVRLLARLLAGSGPRPEAIADSIMRALRQIPYETDIPAPPPGRDVVEWFLFEERRGYCDYFASTFVVLARANGLPARLVLGYAPGTFDPNTQTYLVSGREAHAWAEVWIDGRGWVEYDPTPAAYTTLRVRPAPPGPLAVWTARLPPLRWLAALALGVSVTLLAIRAQPWRDAGATTVLDAWAAIQRRARRLGLPLAPSSTPAEQAETLAAAVQSRLLSLRLGPVNLVLRPPDLSAAFEALAAAYARARYGPPAPATTIPGWRRLLRVLWWLLLRPGAGSR